MKRSPALQVLSRDHQHALDVALRLRRADATTVRDAVHRLLTFFEEGERHFRAEESCLVPALLPCDSAWAAALERMACDHAAIREQVAAITKSDYKLPLARSVGSLLQAHVRFEERVLFPMLERALPNARLEALAKALYDFEQRLTASPR